MKSYKSAIFDYEKEHNNVNKCMVIEKRHSNRRLDSPFSAAPIGCCWSSMGTRRKKRVGKKEYEHTIQNRMRLGRK